MVLFLLPNFIPNLEEEFFLQIFYCNIVPYLIFLIRITFFKKPQEERKIVFSVISFCSLNVYFDEEINKEEIKTKFK